MLNLIVKGSEVTCVGTFEYVGEGNFLNFMVSMWNMPHMDSSLKWSLMKQKLPEDSIAMERYLGSGAIKGVGAALARNCAKV